MRGRQAKTVRFRENTICVHNIVYRHDETCAINIIIMIIIVYRERDGNLRRYSG